MRSHELAHLHRRESATSYPRHERMLRRRSVALRSPVGAGHGGGDGNGLALLRADRLTEETLYAQGGSWGRADCPLAPPGPLVPAPIPHGVPPAGTFAPG